MLAVCRFFVCPSVSHRLEKMISLLHSSLLYYKDTSNTYISDYYDHTRTDNNSLFESKIIIYRKSIRRNW